MRACVCVCVGDYRLWIANFHRSCDPVFKVDTQVSRFLTTLQVEFLCLLFSRRVSFSQRVLKRSRSRTDARGTRINLQTSQNGASVRRLHSRNALSLRPRLRPHRFSRRHLTLHLGVRKRANKRERTRRMSPEGGVPINA